MPVLSVFQTILRSGYNIEKYTSFMLGKNFDFKLQWISYKKSDKKYLNMDLPPPYFIRYDLSLSLSLSVSLCLSLSHTHTLALCRLVCSYSLSSPSLIVPIVSFFFFFFFFSFTAIHTI